MRRATVASVLFVIVAVALASAQSARPAFEVVSVKPCDPNRPLPDPARGRGNPVVATPARLHVDCQSAYRLIGTAYITYANGRLNRLAARPTLEPFIYSPDLPEWARKDLFTVEATAAGEPPPAGVMQGPMLQAVLEDRFKVKIHRETREVPIQELVVAKGGAKVTPCRPGTCVPYDTTVSPQPPLEPGL